MNLNGENKGFSGIAGLVSDLNAVSPEQGFNTAVNTCITEKTRADGFELLSFNNWPTLPAPWSSVDEGETWVWGDFFLTFQKSPATISDLAIEIAGERSRFKGLMTYPYAMTVFYRLDKNPHGPSKRPIMVVALEQSDKNSLEKMAGTYAAQQGAATDNMGPIYLGMFFQNRHHNYGEFDGLLTPETVKKQLFDIVSRNLGLTGQPRLIGNLKQAFGHPETGLTLEEVGFGKSSSSQYPSKKSRVVLQFTFTVLIILVLGFGIDRIISNENKFYSDYGTNSSTPGSVQKLSTSGSISEVQTLLLELGYSPGRVDGIVGPATLEAVRSFRKDSGLVQNSSIDFQLLSSLRVKKANRLNGRDTVTNKTSDMPSLTVASKDDIKEAQQILTRLGYDPGPSDGISGAKTIQAISAFEDDHGIEFGSSVNDALLAELRKRLAGKNTSLLPNSLNSIVPPSSTSSSTAFQPPTNTPGYAEQPLPKSGSVQSYSKKERIAPLEIMAAQGSNYLVKLVDVYTGSTLLTVFVRSGTTVNVDVPLGTYEIRYASGTTWYGYDSLFGSETACSKADKVFTFEVIDNQISGFTITLYKVVDGNLSTSSISRDKF